MKTSSILLGIATREKRRFMTTVISHACGTMGYVEPEYVRSGLVTKKDKDGILLLADVAKEYYVNNKLDMLIDPYLWEQMSPNALIRFSTIAYKCLLGRMHRPVMEVVKKELEETLKFEV
ncbi:hypothetical protein L1987_46600 [Smallanthus sonchifolius]|uniref:Uncharacterized protein n=1 Tax=Smallanthus sonchifolius TaxID=185202 RepID=A0ACB9G167_9ASTR|nr:hypothetical protein L1987_46600 [Smallanthus sonchifolius]